MKLVADWKKSLRWWSVRAAVVLAAMPPAWTVMPPDVKAMMPDTWQPWVVSLMAVGIIVGRLKDQGGGA